jgi:hypothetical protein
MCAKQYSKRLLYGEVWLKLIVVRLMLFETGFFYINSFVVMLKNETPDVRNVISLNLAIF